MRQPGYLVIQGKPLVERDDIVLREEDAPSSIGMSRAAGPGHPQQEEEGMCCS